MKYIIYLIIAILSFPFIGNAAVTFDAGEASGTWQTSTSSITFSHTVSGSDPVLIVTAHDNTSASNNVSSVTYNGVSMSFGARGTTATQEIAEIWYLVGPDTGTHNVVITWGSSATVIGGAASFNGGNAVQNATGNNGISATASVTITSATDNMVVGGATSDDVSTFTSNDTEVWKVLNNPNGGAGGQYAAGAASVTLDWTLGGVTRWAAVGIDIVAGVQGGGGATGGPKIIEEY